MQATPFRVACKSLFGFNADRADDSDQTAALMNTFLFRVG